MTSQSLRNLPHHHLMADFYPILSPNANITQALRILPPLLEDDAVTALRFAFDTAPERPLLESLGTLCHTHNVALILAPASTRLLQGLSFERIDGLHFPDHATLVHIPSTLGKKHNLQIGCTTPTLDDAMQAGEKGADYVSLPATALEALTQWNHMTELPSVAEPVTNATEAQAATHARADFLAFMLQLDGQDKAHLTALKQATNS